MNGEMQTCNMDERTNEEKLRDMMDSQTDTYMHMFDAVCEERKHLLDLSKRHDSVIKGIQARCTIKDAEIRGLKASNRIYKDKYLRLREALDLNGNKAVTVSDAVLDDIDKGLI